MNIFKKYNKIISTATGVESTLVLSQDLQFTDYFQLSIQSNKHITPDPIIALVTTTHPLKQFLSDVYSEITGRNAPDLSIATSIQCSAFCEILNFTKIQNGEYEMSMYYNYARHKNKHYQNSVALTTTDLLNFFSKIPINLLISKTLLTKNRTTLSNT